MISVREKSRQWFSKFTFASSSNTVLWLILTIESHVMFTLPLLGTCAYLLIIETSCILKQFRKSTTIVSFSCNIFHQKILQVVPSIDVKEF